MGRISLYPGMLSLVENYPVSQYGSKDINSRIDEMLKVANLTLRLSRQEIKDIFSTNESLFLVESLSDISYFPQGSLKEIVMNAVVFDIAIKSTKWGINPEILKSKVVGLTEHQSYAILANTFDFWSRQVISPYSAETLIDNIFNSREEVDVIEKN